MNTLTFLTLVLPPQGNYFAVGLGGAVKTIPVTSLDELATAATSLHTKYKQDAYFAVSTFTDRDAGRTAVNSNQIKSFFLDVDCGVGKPYATKEDGLTALKGFAKTLGLPRPTLVDSGRGIHAYWPLSEPITSSVWKPLAEGLKQLCIDHKFEVDLSVPADKARILRVPGTHNLKDPDNPLPVRVVGLSPTYNISIFEGIFPAIQGRAGDILGERPEGMALDEATKALMANKESSFRRIIEKCVAGTGCAQLHHITTNQAGIEEPLWRAGLSIAAHCEDSAKAIHVISRHHPNYDPKETEHKASLTKGPYTCETFARLNPKGCEGCPHKITSPIQLGRVVKPAPPGPAPVIEFVLPDYGTTPDFDTMPIPAYPWPFFRGSEGGVYHKEDQGADDTMVCPYDIYPVRRIRDPDAGEVLVMRLHTPKDGVSEFLLPLVDALAKDRLRDKLAMNGVAVIGKRLDRFMNYLTRWTTELQHLASADKARRQFGWIDDGDGFIIGDKEIRANKILYSPPTAGTIQLVPMFHSHGDFHEWRDVINAYARPDMQARAFAFFMGFGNLLLHMTPLNGYVLSLKSQSTGTGKTTILQAINSIYGHPDKPMMQAKDTMNQKMHRISVFRHLPVTLDEATDLPPEQKGAILYDMPQGRQKNRMRSQENMERTNNDTWATGIILTTNRSVRDDMLAIKAAPEGELARLIELHIAKDTRSDPVWSRNHFKRLRTNYGHACYPFVNYIINNAESVTKLVETVQAKIDKAANTTSQERYWSVMAAIAIAGGTIAQYLNLHNIDIAPVYKFIVDHIRTTRVELREILRTNSDFVAGMLQRRYHEILVINGKADSRTGLDTMPIKEPRGALVARYEPDTKVLYIAAKEFRVECSRAKMNYTEALQPYKDCGAFLGQKRKRLSAGTKLDVNANMECLWFDTRKLEFASMMDGLPDADNGV